MFRATSPQRPLFGVEHRLDNEKRARMERTWTHPYRMKALGLLDENRFAKYFDPANGRPNKSLRLVVSILVLKEVFDLTDEETLARLEWDLSWHCALDLLPEEAHTCQKTLHNFRKLLLGDDQGAGLFESTTAKLIESAGLCTRRQRQDSMHILSNIKILTRLGLFTETITQFLQDLRKEHPRLCAQVSEQLLGRYLDREVEQVTPGFKQAHKIRSGIEATNSELKRCHGFDKLAVRRRPRVNLSVRFKVLALNIKCYVQHLGGNRYKGSPGLLGGVAAS